MSIDPKRCRAVFQKLERDLIKLASEPQAQSVHRFRTGTRRLEILLGHLSPGLDRNEKKLLRLLGRIRKRAGKVRDLDVQSAALRSLKVPREPRRKTQLVNQLIELRAEQEKKLRKTLDRATIRDVRKRLKRAAKRFHPEASGDPLAVARGMLQRIQRASEPLSEAVLHQFRILSKRARYAAEFAVPSPAGDRFIAEIKGIQDASGDWHDWLTLTETANQRLGDLRESPLVAELHNVTGAKYRHAISVLSKMRAQPPSASQLAAKPSAAAAQLPDRKPSAA
jgi:CHAD domain-containing protein